MTLYSALPKDYLQKTMYFCLLLKIQAKRIGKNINKNLSGKYNQKLFDNAKQYATDAPKSASERAV